MGLFWPGISSVRWWSLSWYACGLKRWMSLTGPAESHPNQTICPTLSCTDRICRPAWHRIQPQGGKEYMVHSIHYYTYIVQTFSWLLLSVAAQSSASGPQSGKAPYHSLPLPHLFYLYISVVQTHEPFPDQGFHPWGGEAWTDALVGWRGGWVWPGRRSYHYEPARSCHHLPWRLPGTRMNEWMNEPFILVFTLGPTVSAREKNSRTRTDIFNRASHPVIICISFLPPCPTPLRKMLLYLTPALTMHQSNPFSPGTGRGSVDKNSSVISTTWWDSPAKSCQIIFLKMFIINVFRLLKPSLRICVFRDPKHTSTLVVLGYP